MASEGGLHWSSFEKDSCGFGFIANLRNRPTHWLVAAAIQSLQRLAHRGAVAEDGKTGDGCGLQFKLPDAFLRRAANECGIVLPERYAVGQLFLHPDTALQVTSLSILQEELEKEGFCFLGLRRVPVRREVCGSLPLATLPDIVQIFVEIPLFGDSPDNTASAERHLFIARRRAEKRLLESDPYFYVVSLSTRTIIYKGMVTPEHLPDFYPDLRASDFASSLAFFHQRFSTNTFPQWRLAQPFRYLAHNGEINTITGNRQWAYTRNALFRSQFIPDMADVLPFVSGQGSDSMALDNMLEGLVAGGMDIRLAARLLVPPAWQNIETMDPDLRAMFEYYSLYVEPWDGPAGLILTDGRYALCTMDRNGLRPARYVITREQDGDEFAHANSSLVDDSQNSSADGTTGNDYLIIASEIGVYDYAPGNVLQKGRLGPADILCLDTETGEITGTEEINNTLKSRQPYRQWIYDHTRYLKTHYEIEEEIHGDSLSSSPKEKTYESSPLAGDRGGQEEQEFRRYAKQFLLTAEEHEQVLFSLAEAGQEMVSAMGDDTALAVLSRKERPLYEYFRQQFAQVTNPPIDPIREQSVMSLRTCFGPEKNIFEELPEHGFRIEINAPILSYSNYVRLLEMHDQGLPHHRINLNYTPAEESLKAAIERITREAVQAVRTGHTLLILTDRPISRETLPIHALLATGAVHNRLIREGLRCVCNILAETATARDPHHFAVLIGNGATAVYPYLAYQAIDNLYRKKTDIPADTEHDPPYFMHRYRQGIYKGLLKILSKMGISTVNSYRGAQLFEILGLHQEVVDLCFPGTVSRIQGAGFEELEADQRALHAEAWRDAIPLRQGGLMKYLPEGEYHGYNPAVVQSLQKAVKSGRYEDYQAYAALVNNRPPMALRDLLTLRPSIQDNIPPWRRGIGEDNVEPIESIVRRFDSAAMSLGAISPEAHETLAIAMNRLGGRSNSGEGGEDPARYGTDKVSKIKQIASARFGVTPSYLIHAEVLQIKIAQGAKPGEGGQLPGNKVTDLIARLRFTQPGTTLISPPPHHDIYSIEDLAQLIFDLKQANPEALVSVKLVAEPGVGTVAAGVAKAYADIITIAGHDGGTGASPVSSVRYAGIPWELGVREAHEVLVANNLRHKIRLQADGGLKTGLDVVKAAILGAESFGFGTAPLIALGCKYLRICHLNNCATGVATQNPFLRENHFNGDVERVVNYFQFVAREVREWLAYLGVKRLDEIIGRTDLLAVVEGQTPRQRKLDLSALLSPLPVRQAEQDSALSTPYCTVASNPPADPALLAEQMVRDTHQAIATKSGGTFHYTINNTHRAIGARLSGEIAKRYGDSGMVEQPLHIHLQGTAGQSFGAWNAGGLHLLLEGDANDYVGKGMAGGKIVLFPPKGSVFASQETPIIGNTCLYGATGGQLYAAGQAGERFAVRNSGALAVVEGLGHHGCEYMTGGVVVTLGRTGHNFGAGMTGGCAFVLDTENDFMNRYNPELIDIHRINNPESQPLSEFLHQLIQAHVQETGSVWGHKILDNFPAFINAFWFVKPKAVEITSYSYSCKFTPHPTLPLKGGGEISICGKEISPRPLRERPQP